jgi:hypothetical protein
MRFNAKSYECTSVGRTALANLDPVAGSTHLFRGTLECNQPQSVNGGIAATLVFCGMHLSCVRFLASQPQLPIFHSFTNLGVWITCWISSRIGGTVSVRFTGSRGAVNSLVLVSLFWIISCGANHGRLTTSASRAPANLTINANGLDFGSVAIGSSKSSAITLSNSSAAVGRNVLVNKILSSGMGFTFKPRAIPIALSVGQSLSLTVTFTPRSAGTNTGQLSVSIQGGRPPVLVPLTGVGVGFGQLGANPLKINFGTVAIGASKNQNGFITAGAKDVRISSASWIGQGYSISGTIAKAHIQIWQRQTFSKAHCTLLARSAGIP